jgi:BirA family biotin operon repressor/biotin-[acetyl-CoA-carboxylase] ligase
LGPDPAEVRTLPLVAGWAVIDALGSLGIAGLRLRWPNDIMAGPLKVAGLLVDGYPPDRAVVGIGVNVTNRPAVQDPSLQSTATRLADLSALPPALPALAEVILGSLRTGVEILFNQGFAALGPRINALWGGPRSVRLDLDGVECTGMFTGVDDSGCLQLVQPGQPARRFAPHEVRLLREI